MCHCGLILLYIVPGYRLLCVIVALLCYALWHSTGVCVLLIISSYVSVLLLILWVIIKW